MEESEGRLSKPVAVIACIAMTLFYVAILYAPTLILRLPPPQSYENFMIRRFICAAVCSVASVIFCALVLPITSGEASYSFGVYGIRSDHFAPVTEELVFRACMIPLLLCGGFKAYNAIFLCPTFFSLAHLNHMMEIYSRHNYSLLKASLVVGLQLGYTVVFGSYASFLFIRTGNIVAPLVAHAFCNYMGLPVLFVHGKGPVSIAFVAGMVSFVWLLFPITQPDLYNENTNNCRCWQGYCSWNQ
uniref:intramembrane prenyl-peptidase Rce1 n=1 Tax=Gossypium raimondii TaxID=29730 RepID=A0A0D2QVZ3_GOSRA|nr:hypothetical protein B456_009G404000 [Gossypium raimondii]